MNCHKPKQNIYTKNHAVYLVGLEGNHVLYVVALTKQFQSTVPK